MKTKMIQQAILIATLSALSLSAMADNISDAQLLKLLTKPNPTCSDAHNQCVQQCMNDPDPLSKIGCISSCPACQFDGCKQSSYECFACIALH